MMHIFSNDLIHRILQQYSLPLNGLHGISHWARVLENGTRVAQASGASVSVAQLFALFHDARRINESRDPGHGQRGAEYARILRDSGLFTLSDAEFDLLHFACVHHTEGLIDADMTVQACWDADRLDLYRANIAPKPERLCTQAAKAADLLLWANERAQQRIEPAFIKTAWNIWITPSQ